MVRRRALAARACLAAIALTLAVVPGLHALVHVHEAAEAAHEREHAHALEHLLEHDHGHEHGEHGHRGRHHHDHHGGRPTGDDSPLEHGRGAPEHLGLALLESDPPALAAAGQLVESQALPAPSDHIEAAARTRAHGSRAPPRDLASLRSI